MKASKRFGFQILLWLFIWFILWFQQGMITTFIQDNWIALSAQITLLAFLIYYNAPQFLFTKKHFLFLAYSMVGFILFCSLIWLAIGSTPVHPPIRNGIISPIHPTMIEIASNQGVNSPTSKFFIDSLLVIVAYILGTVVEFMVYTQKRDEEIIISKNENLQTELKFLKSQINPHFLFNALNNIYALSAIDTAKTQQSINYLSDMLRYVLYECDRPTVSLNKEVAYINNYIKLFALKSSKSYPITTDIEITNHTIEIAPMLLIPFVENALKHSNIEKVENTFIRIVLNSTDKSIDFIIENSVGLGQVTKDEVGGIGLENVRKRLDILYPNRYTLKIENKENTFSVQLQLNHHV